MTKKITSEITHETVIDAHEMTESANTKVSSKIGYWVFFAFMTAMYAYATVASFGNVTGVMEMGAQLDMTLSLLGVFWAGFIIGLPVIVYAIMILFGVRKTYFQKSLLLFLGLTVTSAWFLNMTHFMTLTNVLEF